MTCKTSNGNSRASSFASAEYFPSVFEAPVWHNLPEPRAELSFIKLKLESCWEKLRHHLEQGLIPQVRPLVLERGTLIDKVHLLTICSPQWAMLRNTAQLKAHHRLLGLQMRLGD